MTYVPVEGAASALISSLFVDETTPLAEPSTAPPGVMTSTTRSIGAPADSTIAAIVWPARSGTVSSSTSPAAPITVRADDCDR